MERPDPDNGSHYEVPGERVFVVDDDADMRRELRTLLEAGGFRVDTFDSAAGFLAGGAAAATGCVLADVRMPDMNGLELQSELTRCGSRLAVVIMADHGLVAAAVRAMKAGAVDFLEKPFSEATLLDCVRRALQCVSSAKVSSSLVDVARQRIACLTTREKQVFDLVVAGSSNKIIAQELRISPRTVEIHRARATSKMGAKSVTDLVRMAIAGARPTAP